MKIKQAILILTNGNASAKEVSKSTRLRLKKIKEIQIDNSILVTSSGYTVNKPPYLNENGFPVLEAILAAHELRNQINISDNQVFAESFSRDTIGNLFLTISTILIPLQIKQVVVISSAFHMNRVKLICKWLGSIFVPHVNFTFIESKNPEFSAEVRKTIKEKENSSIKNLQHLYERIKNPEEFVPWFYHEHKAYSHYVFPDTTNKLIKETSKFN